MTGRLRDWLSPHDDGSTELDKLLTGTWQDGANTLGEALDLAAGRAALLSAARDRATGHVGTMTAEQDGLLAEVCKEIDMVLATVTAEGEEGRGPAHSAVMAYLFAARKFLIQLRFGLLNRTLAKSQASQLVTSLDHALSEAASRLRQLATPQRVSATTEASELRLLLASWQQQLPGLARRIDRLFDDAADTAPRVPVPHR
jgi:hypothetical protein